jgi:hypothetical protein
LIERSEAMAKRDGGILNRRELARGAMVGGASLVPERFSSFRGVSSAAKGSFFLKKKLLGSGAFPIHQLENRCRDGGEGAGAERVLDRSLPRGAAIVSR